MYTLRKAFIAQTLTVSIFGWVVSCASSSPNRSKEPLTPAILQQPLKDTAFWQTADGIHNRCEADIKEGRRLEDSVVIASGTLGALSAYNDLLVITGNLSGQMNLLLRVHPEDSVREAAADCSDQLREFSDRIALDGLVYQAIGTINTRSLAPEARRFLRKELRGFRLKGLDLPSNARKEMQAIADQLQRIRQAFLDNIRQDIRHIKVQPEQLRGLPKSFIQDHKPEDDGLIRLETTYADYIPVQTLAHDASIRRALAQAFYSRGYPKNTEVLKELLRLRYRYAQRLGFANWADYTAQDKMVRSGDAILHFTEQVTRFTQPRLRQDLAELLAIKQADDPSAKTIHTWDLRYYLEKQRSQHQYREDLASARQYFSTPEVIKGIISVLAELFQVTISPSPSTPVWHKSVQRYQVEQSGSIVGYFYIDMYRRKDKYPGTAMFPMRLGIAEGQLPEASLVSSIGNKNSKEDLMSHQEVVTLFHEFGLLFHHLFARSSRWISLTGANVEWDFILTPALVFEEWAWAPEVLQRFAKHHKSGEIIPRNLVSRLRKGHNIGTGIVMMQQAFYQALSLALHTADPNSLELNIVTEQIAQRYSSVAEFKGTHLYANFHQLGSYSTLLYTQQWSLARAKDILTRFPANRLPEAKVINAFRDKILAPGGTQPASRILKNFLGRQSNQEALRLWLNPSTTEQNLRPLSATTPNRTNLFN
ncbi:MAG: hypothetical protein KTR25_20500 [Myxococcales bacterium]|nr:hypothetical protein [Myxococcales bacterium]